MKARIVTDEPISDQPIGAKLMKEITVELWADDWTKTVKLTVPAEDETMHEIDLAVRKILRENGKDETLSWA
jgi:hypothetical protein